MRQWFAAAAAAVSLAPAVSADTPAELAEKARAALQAKEYPKAVDLAARAAQADPKAADPPTVAGLAHLALRQNAEAVAAFTKAIELSPAAVGLYDRRGDANLKLGKFKDAVADFDKFLEANPKYAPEHWRRGIALYYVARFEDGKKQFEVHKTANPEDVENAAWHYLCNAKVVGKEKARGELIDVTKDPRVPMAEIQKLFAGKLKPEDVLKAAEDPKLTGQAQKEARFYANLYVGLYYESEGDAAKALEHLAAAVEKYKIGHYMWDVGDAHVRLIRGKGK